jgi:predicted dehydrogenase
MTERIRWGILGTAAIARSCILPAIHKSNNSTAYALATRSPHSVGNLCAQHAIQCLYGSYDELLADSRVEVIYNPLPNHLHHSSTLRALQAGKHVLCEKPLACSAAEARAMVEAAHRSGLLLMESWSYRFHPRSLLIKKMLGDGVIGMPALLRIAFCFHLDQLGLGGDTVFRLNPDQGGGALLDVGCYGVSLARWLLGLDPLEVQAQSVLHSSGADVHTVGSMRFPGDILATLEASFVTALQQTFTVVGTGGVIELPHDAFIPWEKEACFTVRGRQDETGIMHHCAGADAYQLMVEHFSDAVRGTQTIAYAPSDGVANMRVLDALARAAKTGSTVHLCSDVG